MAPRSRPNDVAYTWATHVKYNTPTGAANKDYIEDIDARIRRPS